MNINQNLSYLPAIDGLRAIAVLSVIAFHLHPALLSGGFAGVDIFFVISGYVVARSLKNRTNESFGQFLLGFYSRRIRRILPALIVCLLITTLFTVWFIPDSWLSSTTRHVALFAFFGLSNLALVMFQDDYFSPRAEFNPFVHTWSLGVEEQFYFIFPFVMFLWFFTLQTSSKPAVRILVSSLIPVLALISLFIAYHIGVKRPDWAYYMLPARFWELAAGVILFQLQNHKKLPNLTPTSHTACLIIGLILIAAGLIWSDQHAFPFPWAILPVTGTVLLIMVMSNESFDRLFISKLFMHPLLTWIGRLSYSLYLWHWPVFTLMRWTTGIDSVALMLVGLALTLVLASASYYFIETPLRQTKFLKKPVSRAVIIGVLFTTSCWYVAGYLFDNRSRVTLSKTGNTIIWYPYAYDEDPRFFDILGPPNENPLLEGQQMFVIGNSHTGAYTTMVSLLEQRHGIKTQLLQTGVCAMGNLMYAINPIPGCENTIANYVSLLEQQAKPGDIVFLASLRTHRIADQWDRTDPESALLESQSEPFKANLESAYQETLQLVQTLSAMGMIILIDAPKPVLKAPVYRCSDWFNQYNPICTENMQVERKFMELLRTPVMHSIHQLQSQVENVHLWDPLPSLCNEEECPAFDASGQPLFFDGDHLSAHGNRVLYPSFEERVLRLKTSR